jgi:hypothetical protein
MEESSKSLLKNPYTNPAVAAGIVHSIYSYSSRYISIPPQEK